MALVAGYSSSSDEEDPAPEVAPKPCKPVRNLFGGAGADDSDSSESEEEDDAPGAAPVKPAAAAPTKLLPSALDAFDAFEEPEFLQSKQQELGEDEDFLATKKPRVEHSPVRDSAADPRMSMPEGPSEWKPEQHQPQQGRGAGKGAAKPRNNTAASKDKASFNQKEKVSSSIPSTSGTNGAAAEAGHGNAVTP